MTTKEELAKLSVQLELQTAAFEKGVKDMDRQLKRMNDQTQKSSKRIGILEKSIKGLGKSFAGLAAGLSVGLIAQQAKEAIEFADGIAKTADKVGVTTAELQELRFAAGQTGIETRTLDMALQRFARRMGEAAQGTGELLKTTKELGIEFQDENGRYFSTTELLKQYADAMGKAETQQEKLRLAFKAFDSEGAALVNLLGNGSEEMEELREQAVELGLVLDEDLTRVAEQLNDKMEILTTQIKVGLSDALLRATYRLANFLGLTEDDATKVAFYSAEIKKLAKEIEELRSGERRGGEIYVRERALEISKLAQKQYDLRKELGLLPDATKEAFDPEPIVGQGNELTRLAEKYKAILNPLIPLKAEIEQIWSTVGNGLEQSEAWILIAKAVDEYNEKVNKAVEETDDAAESFDDLIAGINTALNAPPPIPPLPDDWLADIGVGFGEVEEKADESLDRILQAVNGFSRDFTNTLVDGLKTGEFAFDDFAKSVLETIVKMMLNDVFTQFFELIYGGIKTYFGIGTTTTGTDPTRGMARGAEASTAMVGTVTGYASPKSMSNKGRVTVNVNNYGSDDVSVTERQDSNGGIDIDILIKNKVNSGFARGDYDKVVASAFGIRRLGY